MRAEALFRRFQRTVAAIDKKSNFPEPSVRQRKPIAGPEGANNAHTKSKGKSTSQERPNRSEASGRSVPQTNLTSAGAESEKVVSPELRGLLSQKVITVDKEGVKQHGGGVGR